MTDPLAPLLNLASPAGVITLLMTAGGIYLFILVSLGGVGSRDFPKGFRIILGVIALVITFFGCIGMTLVTYPAISPGIQSIREDFANPTVIPTVESQQNLTPPSPTRSTPSSQRFEILTFIFGAVMLMVLIVMAQILPSFISDYLKLFRRK